MRTTLHDRFFPPYTDTTIEKIPLMKGFVLFSAVLYACVIIVGSLFHYFTLQPIIRNNHTLYVSESLEKMQLLLENSIQDDVAIIVQAAQSPIVIKHFTDPSNEQVREWAIADLMSRRNTLSSNSIYWVNDSDRIVYVDNEMIYEVDSTLAMNYWYPLTLHDTELFNLNINYNRELGLLQLWINAPVRDYNNHVIGMLGTGIFVEEFVVDVYDQYLGSAQIYLLDHNGVITGSRDVIYMQHKLSYQAVFPEISIDLVSVFEEINEHETLILRSPMGLVGVKSLSEFGWYAVSIVSPSLSDYWSPITQFFVVIIFMIGLIILLFNLFIYRLLRPLRGAIADITERKVMEKSDEAKSEFLSRFSHEIRTPINAIMGYTDLALLSNITTQQDYLPKIKTATTKLLSMVDHIIDIYDIEHGKLSLKPSAFNLMHMLHRIYETAKLDALQKKQQLHITINPDVPSHVIGDEKRIAQVYLLLLWNAFKFSREQTEVNIHVQVVERDTEHVVIHTAIKDQGVGISKDKQAIIFQPFIQGEGGINRKFDGFGVGLTISRFLVELMDGHISYETQVGVGTTFAFTYSLALDSSSQVQNDISGSCVLIVDDVDINRELIITMLEDLNLILDCASNGEEAYQKVCDNPRKYQLILMDINMPYIDGIEATRLIRALDNSYTRKVPILAVTANTLSQEVNIYMKAGMNDHISKPIDMVELQSKIHFWLS